MDPSTQHRQMPAEQIEYEEAKKSSEISQYN